LSLMFATRSHQWPPCRTGIITWEKKRRQQKYSENRKNEKKKK